MNIIKVRYKEFRKSGHDRITSSILAPTMFQILIVSIIAGIIVELIF